MNKIPLPAITRLCSVYQFLLDLEREGVSSISSSELERRLGISAHNVRKDISFLGGAGCSGSGYDVSRLKELIGERLGFFSGKKACLVGLGRLGSAILQHSILAGGEFEIVAGFDSNINKLETIRTTVSVFPSHQIAEVVRRMGITLGITAVPASSLQEVADRLIEGGVRGIVNFSPAVLKPACEGVFIRNVDITAELRILSAQVRVRGENF